jgi:hypothetical protein
VPLSLASLPSRLVNAEPELLKLKASGNFFHPGQPCYYGETPLSFAVSTNHFEIVSVIRPLVTISSSVYIVDELRHSLCPAFYVFSISFLQVEFLIESGADFLDTDSFGNTALHMCMVHDLKDMAMLLLQRWQEKQLRQGLCDPKESSELLRRVSVFEKGN